MTNTDYSDLPLRMEALIDDAIGQIVKLEDAQGFFMWMREHIADYYTGPDVRQGRLFGDDATSNSEQIIMDSEMLRVLGVTLASMIWNSTPLPSNHFKPRPLPRPRRNDLCSCGSGRKYKHCCAGIPAMPVLSVEEIWPILFDKLDKETAARAIRKNHVPVYALGMIASDYIESGQPKKAATLLSPLFDDNIRKTNDDAEYALTLLCNALDDLGHKKKKIVLLQKIIDTTPRSPLRSGAWQRLATIRMDKDDVEGAWEAFQHAQRDDPDSTGLGLLEVQILTAQGHNERARQRAGFWVRQMRRAGMTDDDPPMVFMLEVVRDPVGAFADFGPGSVDNAGLLLRQWLESVRDRPVPEYTIDEEKPSVNDGMRALRGQLSSCGMDEEQIQQALDDMPNPFDNAGDDDANDREEEGLSPDPALKSLQPPSYLDELEREWHGIFPLGKPFSVHDIPAGDDDPWSIHAEKAWVEWLRDHPAAFDSLDILDDLATVLMLHPQFGAVWLNETLLHPLLQRAAAVTEMALAAAGNPPLPWVILDNRPALRSLARLVNASLYIENDEDKAMELAWRVIRINPDDNHGFRAMVMNRLVAMGMDQEALQLAGNYPRDMHPEITFGKILVLYRLGRKKEAVEALGDALEFHGKIPRYLTAKRVRKPKLHPDGIQFGGDDQAWLYREAMREVWLHGLAKVCGKGSSVTAITEFDWVWVELRSNTGAAGSAGSVDDITHGCYAGRVRMRIFQP